MDQPKFYTVQEVADILKIHWQTVLTYIKSGKINAVKMGKGYRILKKDLNEFIQNNKTK